MSTPSGIVTPEAVLLRFETAGIPTRALAKVLDVLVGAAVVMVCLQLVVVTAVEVTGTLVVVATLVASFLALFVYPAVAEARYGTTVGKSVCGLRVVTVEGGPVRGRQAMIRSALQVIDIAFPPVGVIGVGSMLASPLDQRFGDRVAGTIVLRSRSGAVDAFALAFPALPGYEAYVASLDVSAVTPAQYEVLRSFLTRVNQLQPAARAHLADRLARPLAAAMAHALPPGLHPELFCACVASAYQRRHGGPTW